MGFGRRVSIGPPRNMLGVVKPTIITLSVWRQGGSKVFFRMKRSTRLNKLMTAYCDRNSLDLHNTVFVYDGRRIRFDKTPDELEMEDGDEIDAFPSW